MFLTLDFFPHFECWYCCFSIVNLRNFISS